MKQVISAVLLRGVPVSVLLFAAMALLYTVTDLPPGMLRIAAALPVLAGTYLSAYTAARRLRKHALRCGAAAALCLTGIWYLAAVILTGKLRLPMLLLAAVPCGMTGAVPGSGKAAPMPRRRMHRLIPLRTRAAMLPMLLHTPPKAPKANEQAPAP